MDSKPSTTATVPPAGPDRLGWLRMAGLAMVAVALLAQPLLARADRIRDLASIAGVRSNQLVGYGLVVGLDGSGDQTTQTPFTVQSILNMLGNLGITVPAGTNIQPRNVAAVMVTASLPAFARPGQQIDVTVSSMGNAKSLRGGTLILTPLKGADGNIYALAQGNVVVGGAGAGAAGAVKVINHLSAGRVPLGATVERAVPMEVGQGEFVTLELRDTDFGTAQRVADAINGATLPGTAEAADARTIQVRAPLDPHQRVAFLGRIESLAVTPAQLQAKVVINSRTGSVVMNQTVTLQNCAVAHGNLQVSVTTEQVVSQPPPFSPGQTVVTEQDTVEIQQPTVSFIHVKGGANLAEVVKALNSVGATPLDLISILQAMKASGALRAELEVI
jgi:flagellar P-ring protein precursor FlgI